VRQNPKAVARLSGAKRRHEIAPTVRGKESQKDNEARRADMVRPSCPSFGPLIISNIPDHDLTVVAIA
jgi:hypothetical protein